MKVINNDLFNISNRIKKIDKSYFIIFNKLKNRYEVHSRNQKGLSLAFCLDNKLNANALKKAIKTSCKFSKKIIKTINETNKNLQEAEEKNFLEKHIQTLNNYLNYANSKNTDVTF